MNLSKTNIVLAGLLVLVALLAAAVRVDHSQPNVEFLPEMKRSPAASAFSANSVFANRRTLQVPVAGTIPRGELPLHFLPTKEDAVRAGEELANPYSFQAEDSAQDATAAQDSPTANAEAAAPEGSDTPALSPEAAAAARLQESVARGGEVYRVFCISCHGPGGAGDGPVAKRGFPPPPPLTTGKSAQMKDGQLFHILTYGQGSMAPMAAQLTRDRRWDVVNYVRLMQQEAAQAAQATIGESPDTPDADPAASEEPSADKEGTP